MSSRQWNSLISAVRQHSSINESVDTAITDLKLSWFNAPTKLSALVYDPCLCIIIQGSKEVLLAEESHRMDPGHCLLVSVDLPVEARVVEASNLKPYLGLRISLDSKVVGELLADGATIPVSGPVVRGLAVTTVEPDLLDAVVRLTRLLEAPQDIRPLAPLVLREITHRVLTGPQGMRLRQIALAGAPAYRIARAIRWLKEHFAEPFRIENLAQEVGLSASSFYLHFKSVTAMTPLQYQKRIRLQEARRLMFGERLDAAEAAFRVGYESPSQFSREYRRMFGASPRQDVDSVLATPTPQT